MPNNSEGAARSTRGSVSARTWAGDAARRFGDAVHRNRQRLNISAAELSRRTTEFGYPITRGTIAKIEGNHRGGKVDLAEVVTLAAALGVPAIQLLYPDQAYGPVEYLPGVTVASIDAAQHFAGEGALSVGDTEISADMAVMHSARRLAILNRTKEELRHLDLLAPLLPEEHAKLVATGQELERLKRTQTVFDEYGYTFDWGTDRG